MSTSACPPDSSSSSNASSSQQSSGEEPEEEEPEEELADIEKERLANIARNKEILRQLGLA